MTLHVAKEHSLLSTDIYSFMLDTYKATINTTIWTIGHVDNWGNSDYIMYNHDNLEKINMDNIQLLNSVKSGQVTEFRLLQSEHL